jgi:radical SAM superfamily enzyme YgiQ (UPF0313 family)
VASAKAFLERAGFRPGAIDLAVEQLDRLLDDESGDIGLVAISVPMHTALHIGVRAAKRLRRSLPDAHICFFGLYATLNADYLLDGLADSVIGGEFEAPLVRLAEALAGGRSPHEADGLWLPGRPATPHLQKMDFAAPSRSGLPSFDRYAQLEINGLPSPLPPLPHPTRLPRSLFCCAPRGRTAGRSPSRRSGCPSPDLRRPRLLQWSRAHHGHGSRAS